MRYPEGKLDVNRSCEAVLYFDVQEDVLLPAIPIF